MANTELTFSICELTGNVVARDKTFGRAAFASTSAGLRLVWSNLKGKELAKVALATARWVRRNK